jgi:hypothetical protein
MVDVRKVVILHPRADSDDSYNRATLNDLEDLDVLEIHNATTGVANTTMIVPFDRRM